MLKSRIGRHKVVHDGKDITQPPKVGLSCNPSKGWPYRVFYKPFRDGTLPPEYAFIQSLYTDNPHIVEEYGKQLPQIDDKAQRQRLMEGIWDYADEAGTLMRFENVRDMVHQHHRQGWRALHDRGRARYGRDKTVLNLWEGLESYRRERYSEQGTDKTIQLIRDFAATDKIPYSHIIVDEDGVGGGVVDQMPGVKGFVAASSPVPTRTMIRRQMLPKAALDLEGKQAIAPFQNLKAQCGFKLAELVGDAPNRSQARR